MDLKSLKHGVVVKEAEIDLTTTQREELDRRLAALEIDQDIGSPWPTVKARILSRCAL